MGRNLVMQFGNIVGRKPAYRDLGLVAEGYGVGLYLVVRIHGLDACSRGACNVDRIAAQAGMPKSVSAWMRRSVLQRSGRSAQDRVTADAGRQSAVCTAHERVLPRSMNQRRRAQFRLMCDASDLGCALFHSRQACSEPAWRSANF